MFATLAVGARGSDRTHEAARLVDLFDRTCLIHVGDAAGLRRAAAGWPAMTGDAASRLLARPGIVYDASTEGGHMALLSFDDGMCGTVADDVDAATLLADLADGMKRRAIAVSPVGSAPAGEAQLYHLEGGRLDSGSVHVSLMVDLRATRARTQVSMLATPDARPGDGR